jgi:hypothetical protein
MVKKPSEMSYDEIVVERQINAVKKDKYSLRQKLKKTHLLASRLIRKS